MATFSSLGVGAGLDLQSMLTKLMAVERAPLNALQTKIDATSSRISAYGNLRSKLDAFSLSATTLSLPSQLSALAATSGDEKVLGAKASFIAAQGSYDVTVTSLAAAQKSNTAGYTVGTTFTAGAGAKISFTIGEPGNTVIKDIDLTGGGPYSLTDIRNKINEADIGVRATVVNGADGKQVLALTSTATGKQGAFSVAVTDLSPSGGQAALDSLTPQATASDAVMVIDGVTVKSSTNEFTSAVTGVTFSAKSLGSTTVTVAASSERIATALKSFIDAYNEVRSLVASNSGFDVSTKKAGALNGESTVRSVLSALNDARTQVPAELASANLKNLFEIGVSVDQNGKLSLDAAKLSNAVASDPDGVVKLVRAYGTSFSDKIGSLSSGVLSTRISGLESLTASYNTQKTALEARLVNIETGYRRQFTALDRMMSTMTTTSSYLSQQLATLSNSK